MLKILRQLLLAGLNQLFYNNYLLSTLISNVFNIFVCSISFCDLAGSERLKKTMNIGDRLTESKNINTSLLVLNKCFSVLRCVYNYKVNINIC